jgi:hypothetical protein
MIKSRNHFLFVFAVGVCLCLGAVLLGSPLAAQSTFGSITGTVQDASGAAVPDATVTLTSSTTDFKSSFTTGAGGEYTFVNLNPGPYTIEVDKPGFKHVKRTDVTVQVQIGTRIDVALEVGAQSQTVEVTAETPLLQPNSATLGQIVDERKTNEIPLNGRNVFNLILLSPAAVAQGGSGGTPVGQNPFSWGNYQVGGSFANQSAEYLDGQPLNIGYINLPIIIPTQDSVGEFKVEYNNVGAEWGKFSGGVVNFSTKSGTSQYHGEAYEYFRNKVLNSRPYFSPTNPPYTQNQYGAALGGPVPHLKDKLFFYVSWEQFRLRQGASASVYTVPLPQMFTPNAAGFYDFSSLCPGISPTGLCPAGAGTQLYNPWTANAAGARSPYLGDLIPAAQGNQAAIALYQKLYPVIPSTAPPTANFTAGGSIGGNTNQFVTREDYNINSTTRLYGRFTYYGLTDLPTDPFGTGFCADRCSEKYHSKALALDLNHQFSTTTIFDLNVSASRFVYARAPINSGFDLTTLGWGSVYNDLSANLRTPPTPAFTFPNDPGLSQGPGSVIGDHNSQYNFSPVLTLIRGKHTIAVGGQYEIGYDNYVQTNIAAGAFAFSTNWTTDNALAPSANTGFPFADFLLGLADNFGSFVNQTEGVAQVPAQVAGKQTYRALYGQDTWRVTPKLTISAGIRYELQGPWSERFNDLTYWNPNAVNGAVTGCNGVVGSPCTGDAFYVQTGINGSRNNIPLDKRQWSPRLGLAYSWDQKTVIRAGYGIFFIPNYISFGLNADNDVIGLANTPFVATNDKYITPFSTLNGTTLPGGSGCALVGGTPTCDDNTGPFGAGGFVLPPGRNAQPSLSAFVADSGNPTLAPYTHPQPGYVQQYNLDIQREIGGGWFLDAAYAGSHGIHLQQYSTNVNQLPDNFVAQAGAECPGTVFTVGACTPSISAPVTNTLQGTTYGGLTGTTLPIAQFERPYPQYANLKLAGFGCCESSYNSFQFTATKRFKNGGSFLAAYTNSKLMTNTDTLTSWLESSTGGVGQVQDYNNLRAERSLSSQDVSQRLVISYVYDLPFGHGQRYMSDATGVMDKVVSGWGVDGVTTFQKGFPLKISWAGPATQLEALNVGIANIRPDAVPGCAKGAGGTGTAGKVNEWFNTSCFSAPPAYGYGSEARVDSSLRAAGINNWDIALYKTTTFGPENKLGLQFRTEFFNTFNRVQFGFPGTGFNGTPTGNGFGTVTSQANNPRLIQFALKFLF